MRADAEVEGGTEGRELEDGVVAGRGVDVDGGAEGEDEEGGWVVHCLWGFGFEF